MSNIHSKMPQFTTPDTESIKEGYAKQREYVANRLTDVGFDPSVVYYVFIDPTGYILNTDAYGVGNRCIAYYGEYPKHSVNDGTVYEALHKGDFEFFTYEQLDIFVEKVIKREKLKKFVEE